MSNLHFSDLDLSVVPDYSNMIEYDYWSLKKTQNDDYNYIENLFDTEECKQILKLGTSFAINQSKTGDGRGFSDIRKSTNSWLKPSELTNWIYIKIQNAITTVNKFYEYDLTFVENLQFTRYSEQVQGYYGKHVDRFGYQVHPGYDRKLSFSVQITDPCDYKGGDLLIYNDSNKPLNVNKNKGTINFFPSYVLHEVTPVTKGTRHSLVGWVSGPKFK